MIAPPVRFKDGFSFGKAKERIEGSINNGIEIRRVSDGGKISQKVDEEGRVRLHGTTVSQLGVNNPTAMLVEPDGETPYIFVSAMAQTPAPGSPDSTDDADNKVTVGRGVSVWDDADNSGGGCLTIC